LKIIMVAGTRPNFMKVAPIIREIEAKGISCCLVHTGQHFDELMSKIFFSDLGLPEPDVYLGVKGGTHAYQTGEALKALETVYIQEKPDLVVVVGDVNSTLAGALAAVKIRIPVAHVEAGYRSHDIAMPEEINRIIVDRISQMLFAPTQDAVDNLVKEGIDSKRIFFVGNVMAQTLLEFVEAIDKELPEALSDKHLGDYVLATVHRAENTDDPRRLRQIMESFAELPLPVVFPIHPRTAGKLPKELKQLCADSGVYFLRPQGYIDFLKLMINSRLLLTDSGGIQEEALLLGIPCLTLRYNTERVATIELGANKLVGTDKGLIIKEARRILSEPKKSYPVPPLWDKKVAGRIVDAVIANSNLLEIKPQEKL